MYALLFVLPYIMQLSNFRSVFAHREKTPCTTKLKIMVATENQIFLCTLEFCSWDINTLIPVTLEIKFRN